MTRAKAAIPLSVSIAVILSVLIALIWLFGQASIAQVQRPLSVAQLGALEDDIRREQVLLRAEPKNRPLRSRLAHHLDALANYHELRRDNMSAARYFEAAAAVMLDLGDEVGRKQAALLAQRAHQNRQLRRDHLRKIHRQGTVVVASGSSHSPHLDGQAALAYTSTINEKLRDTWSEAHLAGALKAAGALPHFINAVFRIDAKGRVLSVKIVASCGDKAIDGQAESAIKSLKDVPRLLPAMGATAMFRAEFAK